MKHVTKGSPAPEFNAWKVSDDPYMVNLLRLDVAFLRDRRHEVVSRVFDAKFLATATLQELETLRDFFRARGAQGNAQSFGHVLARFAEQRLLDASP